MCSDRRVDHPANGRTRGIAALLEGYFAAMWFGWAQADLPLWLVAPLTVASVLAACIAVAAVVVAIRAHGQHTPMRNPTVRRTYLIIVGVEFAALGAGAGLLAATGLSRWICVWVCAGVGLHFLPLSRALGRLLLVPLGLLGEVEPAVGPGDTGDAGTARTGSGAAGVGRRIGVGASTTCGLVSASTSGGCGVRSDGVGWGWVGLSRSVFAVGGTGRSAVLGWPRSAPVGSRLGDAAAL